MLDVSGSAQVLHISSGWKNKLQKMEMNKGLKLVGHEEWGEKEEKSDGK